MSKKVRLISYMTLRQAIGWLGIALPISMILESWLYCRNAIRPSISDYYYSNLGDVFVAILTALAVFFFSYRGYEKEKDNLLTTISGVSALGIALCPTNGVSMMCLGQCFSKVSDNVYHYIHLICAATFFISLIILLLFYFTKTDKSRITTQKVARNNIYIICGITMTVCLIWMIINLMIIKKTGIFWQETIALFAFGFAWLTKGELLLKDKNKPHEKN